MKLVRKGQLLDRRAETIAGRPTQPAGATKSLAGESFEDSINRLLEESRERFVLVGDLLLDWKESVPHGQFMKVLAERIDAGALRHLSYQSANRYMTVAAALRQGAVAPDELPKESEAAYLLTSLKPNELEAAKQEGLVRPTVKKAELAQFRKRLRSPSLSSEPKDRRTILEERRAELREKLKSIKAELVGVEAELKALG